jgi:hypothetical protein
MTSYDSENTLMIKVASNLYLNSAKLDSSESALVMTSYSKNSAINFELGVMMDVVKTFQ